MAGVIEMQENFGRLPVSQRFFQYRTSGHYPCPMTAIKCISVVYYRHQSEAGQNAGNENESLCTVHQAPVSATANRSIALYDQLLKNDAGNRDERADKPPVVFGVPQHPTDIIPGQEVRSQ